MSGHFIRVKDTKNKTGLRVGKIEDTVFYVYKYHELKINLIY